MWWVLAGLWSAAWATECAAPTTTAQVSATLDAAETAWRAFDDATFHDRVAQAVAIDLPCLAEPLPTEVAARTHLLMALHLWLIGDEARATDELRAARLATAPAGGAPSPARGAPATDAAIDPALLAEDHPLRAVDVGPAKTRKVPEPRAGSVSFDGRVGRDRPRDLPSVMQLYDESGRAALTEYLSPADPMPRYPAVPHRRTSLLVATGGALAVTGGLYAASFAQRSALLKAAASDATPRAELDAARTRLNVLSIGAAVGLGVTVGFGASAAWIGER